MHFLNMVVSCVVFKNFPILSQPLNRSREELDGLIESLRKIDPEVRFTDNELFVMHLAGAKSDSVEPVEKLFWCDDKEREGWTTKEL